ncbi:hypothetical protein NKI96_21245 [Mesorhizobium sp. M0292]
MDFIERWFGVSPDGGNGTTEALYIIAGLVVVVAVLAHWRTRKAKGD